MTVEQSQWPPHLADGVARAYETIDNDPRVLLECAGGPVGKKADLVVGRLFGWDEQIDYDLTLARAEPTVLVPILRPMVMATPDFDYTAKSLGCRAARYTLQSNFGFFKLDASFAPDFPHGPDFLVSVLCLRYRRSDRVR